MYWHKSSFWLKALYPDFVWSKKTPERIIYLTFDDGPIPEVSEWVLQQLADYQARATFFCVGDNIRKHPPVYESIRRAGHTVGNHTYHHLNGWQTPAEEYLENVYQCQQAMGAPARLFRPPYGKISRKSAHQLLRANYQIIMWDVLSGDFDVHLSPDRCLEKSIRYTRSGSIIVFHDSIKARKNLEYVLPRYLDHFASAGYSFERL